MSGVAVEIKHFIAINLKESFGPDSNLFQIEEQTFSYRKVEIWCKSDMKEENYDILHFHISHESFLNSQYEYANKLVNFVIASQFLIDENDVSQLSWAGKTCLISALTMMFALI